jgi:pantoate--beta-alanine ligase
MQVLNTIAAMRAALRDARGHHTRIGLVPTMGALHAGHLSLVRRAREECGLAAASLFVNPTQFGPHEDFDRYPRQLAQDTALFESAGVDLVFAPSIEEMYPSGATTYIDVGDLGSRLDGAHRPGHFRGVATVVAKLFHIIQPDRAYFGQKDAIQVAVLRRMVRDLNFPVELIACPIVRDADGLALSSRNAYLSPEERSRALILPRTLDAMRQAIAAQTQDRRTLLQIGLNILSAEPAVALEYLEIVAPSTLVPVDTIAPGTLIAIAAKVGKTRLIDNFLA